MTAEAVIMNKEAVAMAADSAVTMSNSTNSKIFTSANKIFTLSKFFPVGIMVYGSAELCRVPWETIIKIYRNKLGTKHFNRLSDYSEDFFKYLDHSTYLFPPDEQDRFVYSHVYDHYLKLKNMMWERIVKIMVEVSDKQSQEKAIRDICKAVIEDSHDRWHSYPSSQQVQDSIGDLIKKKYLNKFKVFAKELFQQFPLSPSTTKKLYALATYIFIKYPDGGSDSAPSGLVFAGFGQTEYFPRVHCFDIIGVVLNKTLY